MKKMSKTPLVVAPVDEALLTREVPECDYELLKTIRLNLANGFRTIVEYNKDENGKKFNATDQQTVNVFNAQVLKKFYGLSDNEIIVETGLSL